MNADIKASLGQAHREFFRCIGVDVKTGIVNGPYLKFPSYPHVGSRYGEMRKVMIVGMDIGQFAPEQEVIQSFEDRRASIECRPPDKLNPHMSGTYVTAMHFLADQSTKWQRWLDESDKELVPQALLNDVDRLPRLNPLSYIAFTNYYKFLVQWSGGRLQLAPDVEEEFLVTEAKILAPETIVMQSAGFWHRQKLLDCLSDIANVFIGNHPSVRGEKRRLGNLLKSIQPWSP